jgi:hypothetical protein
MLLGPRMSRISSSGAAADPVAGAVAEAESDAGAEGVTRAGVPPGEYVGAGARSGGGGEKISGVDGTKVTGAGAEPVAAEAGSGGVVPAKDRAPGNIAVRPRLKAAPTWQTRLPMRTLIRACVPGS